MSGFWVVAQTKPQQERWAAENVARQGFSWYLPLTRIKRQPRRPAKLVCVFPRYLFVFTEGQWHSLLGTYGVTSLVMSGNGPATLPQNAVDALKRREDGDGLIILPNSPTGRFKAGEPLRVNQGPFSGITGICAQDSAADRVKVLIEFLGQKSTVLIADDHVERACNG
jgi:transcriptional antiterminator RfaH